MEIFIPSQASIPELYNLAEDIGEVHNIADQYPEIVWRLKKNWRFWKKM